MARTMAGTRTAPQPGVQGTLGGPSPKAAQKPGRRQVVMGDEVYLWILVAVEVGLIAYGRSVFSRYHGG